VDGFLAASGLICARCGVAALTVRKRIFDAAQNAPFV